jgi:peptide-methionine (S)-S-oxide reductase
MKYRLILIVLASLLLYASIAAADKTILAGGCFWCMESDFEKLEGVSDVISGFSGGTLKDPTYNGNHEGHFEAVEITYDPDKISCLHKRLNLSLLLNQLYNSISGHSL